MLTSVAFVVCQVSVVDCPLSRVFGFADSEAVGAVGAGGGGGGGGATFFAHEARNMIMPSANTRVAHLVAVVVVLTFIACFTDSSNFLCAPIVACNLQLDDLQRDDGAHSGPAAKPYCILIPIYFQLQLGCVLVPLKVNCFTFEPSASMVHIWSLPERWD